MTLSEIEDGFADSCLSTSESDLESEKLYDSDNGRIEGSFSDKGGMASTTMNTCSSLQNKFEFHNQERLIHS